MPIHWRIYFMKKIDPAVRRETLYITLSVIALSVLMQLVFIVIGKWNYTVLLGNLLSAAAVILNFFLMGITVQGAVEMDEKDARAKVKFSMTFRMLMLFIVAVLGVALDCFSLPATLIPLFFARIAIAFRPLFAKVLDRDSAGTER